MRRIIVIISAMLGVALIFLSGMACAEGMKLAKPMLKEVNMVNATQMLAFKEFRIQKGQGRSDWFVLATNISGKNMPRNHYKLRAYQVDTLGKQSPAGETVTIKRDIRPGGTTNFTRQFNPGKDIRKVVIEIVKRTDNSVVASGSFNARAAATSSQANAAAMVSGNSSGPSQTAINAGQYTPIDLQLNVAGVDGYKKRLTVKNNGESAVNLSEYNFLLKEHLLLRPADVKSVELDGNLAPGNSISKEVKEGDGTSCANFTHYTAEAIGNGINFHGRTDVSPVDFEIIQDPEYKLGQIDSRGRISEFTYIEFIFNVKNKVDRKIAFQLEGLMTIYTSKREYHLPFLTEIRGISRPGVNRVTVSLQPGFDMGPTHITAGFDKKPVAIKLRYRMVNPDSCGVAVGLSQYFSHTIRDI